MNKTKAKNIKRTKLTRQRELRLGYTVYKSPRTIMPPEFDTTLHYMVSNVIDNNGVAQAGAYWTTSAYDVDPLLGSTAMPGFAELAAFYYKFRTLAIGYEHHACNMEAFPVEVVHGMSNTHVNANSLSIAYGANPFFRLGTLGPLTGQCRGTFKRGLTQLIQIVGTATPLFDDTYTGATTSSSSMNLCYAHLGFIAPSSFTTAGVLVQTKISLRVRFFLPAALVS